MPDKKFEEFIKGLEELIIKEGFNLDGWSDQKIFLERAFKAGRKAQREDMVNEEIADKHRTTFMTDLEKQAVEFMKVNGHEVGNGDLVAQANEVAFDLAMEEELARGVMFEFCGDEYCED